MSALAVLDASSGSDLVLAGLLAVGPCLAAVSGTPRAPLAVGAYALTLITALAWWPDRIWGTQQLLLYLLATAAVTLVSVALARRVQHLEQATAQAQRPLQALAALVEGSEAAVIGVTLDGTVTTWNPGAGKMYGYSAAEMIGENIAALAGPARTAEFPDVLARIAAGQRVEHYETQRTHKDGTVVDISVTVSPIRDEHGVVVGASAVARDISARKRADARQRDVDERTQLAQRLQSLGQLAGGVAHDFNNLLAVILNFTAFVAEQTTHDTTIQTDLTQVRTAAERAAGLTRQLLLFSRGETTRPELLDINTAIAEAHAMLARTIGTDINLVAVPSPEPLMIYADSGQIQQVLVNLAVNARDAMPDGGTLVIEGTTTDLDEHQATLQPALRPGRYARLLVSDTGTGMSKEVAARIFEPFYTTKPTGKGTGLGLATVYGIVTDAGGALNVYSEPNLGTTFRAYFPIADETSTPPTTTPDTAAAPPHGHGQTILVVDDEDTISQIVTRILEPHGYRVLSAGSGTQALAVDAEHSCQLLLTDAIMPAMSGRRLAELLRRRHPGLPVLYMSGYSDGLRGTDIIVDEEFGFIEKPFTASDLLHRIHDLMAHTEAATLVNIPH